MTDLTEKEWDAALFNPRNGLAPTLGWRYSYHTLRSTGSQPGFPDRVLIGPRVIFAELKRERKRPTPTQASVLTALAETGAEVYLWWPSDFDEIALILRDWTWLYGPRKLTEKDGRVSLGWRPGSLWLEEGHRSDE